MDYLQFTKDVGFMASSFTVNWAIPEANLFGILICFDVNVNILTALLISQQEI